MQFFFRLKYMFKFIKLLFYNIKIKTWLIFILCLLILLIFPILLIHCLPEINNTTVDEIKIPFNTIDIIDQNITDQNILIKNKVNPFYSILDLNRPYSNIPNFDIYYCTKNTIINDSKENFISPNNRVFLSEMFRLAEYRSESLRLHHDLDNIVNKLVEEYNLINVNK